MFSKKIQVKSTTSPISPPRSKTKYPMWTFARLENTSSYFLILEKTKFPFISERAFLSWGKPCIVVSEESISGYPNARKIGFAPGSIIISCVDNSQWFLTGENALSAERRLIADPDFWDVLGYDYDTAFTVGLNEIDFHARGKDLT